MASIARPGTSLAQDVCDAIGEAAEPDVRAAVGSLIAAARAVHPGFAPVAGDLARQLASGLEKQPRESWPERMATLDAPNLWFCAALAGGDSTALKLFETRLAPEIDRALGRFSLSADQRTEIAQSARIRLLVAGDGTPARISRYQGWGSLEGWVRTVTARLALNALRDRPPVEPLERAPAVLGANPEFAQLRADRRIQFMQALRAAFHGLPQRERALLRLRYLDGVQANALAQSYKVHESTMSRWLSKAREDLHARFGVEARGLVQDDAAVANLLGAMQSRFGHSLQELLVTEAE